ncbi:MAG: hypothetical protein PHR22_04245 [Candidatus Omnitrophica bacterium]|nr:hypothetical protein [Candidatus Omnitrophota bacterium]
MTKKDILSIACKIFGIYLLIQILVSSQNIIFVIGSLLSSTSSEWGNYNRDNLIFLVSFILPILIFLYAAIYLIKNSDLLGEILCGKVSGDNIQCSLDKDTLRQVLFSSVGVFIIANALVSISSTLGRMLYQYYMRESISANMKLPANMLVLKSIDLTVPFITFIVELIVGLYLIFGSNKLVVLINRHSKGTK